MLRHREAELLDGGAAVGEQALAKRRIDPGPRHDARAVLRNPLFLREVAQLLDRFGRLHPALVQRRLDGVDALLHGGGARTTRSLVRSFRSFSKHSPMQDATSICPWLEACQPDSLRALVRQRLRFHCGPIRSIVAGEVRACRASRSRRRRAAKGLENSQPGDAHGRKLLALGLLAMSLATSCAPAQTATTPPAALPRRPRMPSIRHRFRPSRTWARTCRR